MISRIKADKGGNHTEVGQVEAGNNHTKTLDIKLPNPRFPNPKFLSTDQVVEMFPFLNRGTLANMRSRREGPKFYRVGRKVVYLLDDIEQWLTSQPVLTRDSLSA